MAQSARPISRESRVANSGPWIKRSDRLLIESVGAQQLSGLPIGNEHGEKDLGVGVGMAEVADGESVAERHGHWVPLAQRFVNIGRPTRRDLAEAAAASSVISSMVFPSDSTIERIPSSSRNSTSRRCAGRTRSWPR